MKNILAILSIILAVVLAFTALILFIGLMPLALIFGLIRSYKKEGILTFLFTFFFQIAKGIDQTSNGSFYQILNGLLLKNKGKYFEFGNEDETLSSVLGRNQQIKMLSITGWFFVLLLWIIDARYWFSGGHCVNSIGE